MKLLRQFTSSRLRLTSHRDTTAQLCAIYPFMAQRPLSSAGVYLGTDVLTGTDEFRFDPFTAYEQGLVTNPNVLIAGEPGTGKSTAVKTFLARTASQLGRWLAVVDPKGEYKPLAEMLNLTVIDLYPGGTTRINPLDVATSTSSDNASRQRSLLLTALLSTVMRRDLSPFEEAAVGWCVDEIAEHPSPTLQDVMRVLSRPRPTMTKRAGRTVRELLHDSESIRFGLDRLLSQTMRGMFDGHTTINLNSVSNGVVIDLSRVQHAPDAMAVVMVAITSWLQSIMTDPSASNRIQVLDEAWSLLAFEQASRYLQSCLKLGRSYGVANVIVVHRLSDLRAQTDDGSAASKIAMGLLADTQTRVLFRQASDQLADARSMLGLTAKETEVLARLVRGRAIWKVGDRTAVVAHDVTDDEKVLCDTDQRMRRVASA